MDSMHLLIIFFRCYKARITTSKCSTFKCPCTKLRLLQCWCKLHLVLLLHSCETSRLTWNEGPFNYTQGVDYLFMSSFSGAANLQSAVTVGISFLPSSSFVLTLSIASAFFGLLCRRFWELCERNNSAYSPRQLHIPWEGSVGRDGSRNRSSNL